ncbi:MAG: cysteine desulfurase [Gemmatimonadota bacterium]
MSRLDSPPVQDLAARWRDHYPALQQEVNGHPLTYLDNAATTQKPQVVLDALLSYYRNDNANVHRGIHELSRRATEGFEGARSTVATFLDAPSAREIIFTRGTTEAINLVASSWGNANVMEGDEIVLSVLEHHSNLVPWQLLAARTGARLRYLELDEEGRLRLDMLPELLNERTRMVAVNHVSNSLGTLNPVAEIARAAHEVGALILVDGAQAVPHLSVDVQALGCDFYAFSGHKVGGPTGIGALWGREALLDAMPPYQGGGEMISVVERQESSWAKLPHKFEAGTPHIAGAIALAAALDFTRMVGPDEILAHEQALVAYAMEGMAQLDGMTVYGPRSPQERSGVISFNLGDAHPHDVSTILDSRGVAIRAGHHCCQLVMRHLGVAATSRASFYLYNTREDVDRLLQGLEQVQSIFGTEAAV